jgi:hypothetical protein
MYPVTLDRQLAHLLPVWPTTSPYLDKPEHEKPDLVRVLDHGCERQDR